MKGGNFVCFHIMYLVYPFGFVLHFCPVPVLVYREKGKMGRGRQVILKKIKIVRRKEFGPCR